MKKLLTLSFVLCFVSLAHAQDNETCPGDSIVEVKGGVIYYPKTVQEESYPVTITVVNAQGEPISNAKVRVALSAEEAHSGSVQEITFFPKELQTDSVGEITFDLKVEEQKDVMIVNESGPLVAVNLNRSFTNKNIVVQLYKPEKRRVTYTAKPAIYLYPATQSKVGIKHAFKGTVLNTYPDYSDGWEVIADPSGKLLNIADNRNYSYLFWDGICIFPSSHFDYKDGFYVKKGDYTSFLLNKLALIGLNETEINDFIVYWLPSMNSYDEVLVHFWINDDIDNSSKLDVTPKPDTMIRVFMEFGEYNGEEKLPEQVLTPNKRVGFTLLEWGGSQIGSMDVE